MKYRVVKIVTNNFTGGKKKAEIVWQGSDTIALSEKYPPPSRVFGADQLGHQEIEDGMIWWDHRFEKLENGQWTECSDPRQIPEFWAFTPEAEDLREEPYRDGYSRDYEIETEEDYYPEQYD